MSYGPGHHSINMKAKRPCRKHIRSRTGLKQERETKRDVTVIEETTGTSLLLLHLFVIPKIIPKPLIPHTPYLQSRNDSNGEIGRSRGLCKSAKVRYHHWLGPVSKILMGLETVLPDSQLNIITILQGWRDKHVSSTSYYTTIFELLPTTLHRHIQPSPSDTSRPRAILLLSRKVFMIFITGFNFQNLRERGNRGRERFLTGWRGARHRVAEEVTQHRGQGWLGGGGRFQSITYPHCSHFNPPIF